MRRPRRGQALPKDERPRRRAPLIVDIGCHRGDDTAYYLAKGFDVLAVEANPNLIEVCRSRFADAIESGRLELVHRCVSDQSEEVPFFINENDGWSSLVERFGTRGRLARSVMVRTLSIVTLLEGRGVPDFLKMDVEGAEGRLLAAMRRLSAVPTVIALEVDFYEGDPVADLECLGYDRFRLIRQPHEQADPDLPHWVFTRASSGLLHPVLLDGAVGAARAREEFAALADAAYRWHDLYAFRAADPALGCWLDAT